MCDVWSGKSHATLFKNVAHGAANVTAPCAAPAVFFNVENRGECRRARSRKVEGAAVATMLKRRQGREMLEQGPLSSLPIN